LGHAPPRLDRWPKRDRASDALEALETRLVPTVTLGSATE
jgi:hypothetical protein